MDGSEPEGALIQYPTRPKDEWALQFKVDRLQIIVVAKIITVLQLFISRMPKLYHKLYIMNYLYNIWLNYREQGHSFPYNLITKATIVICLVLQKLLSNLYVKTYRKPLIFRNMSGLPMWPVHYVDQVPLCEMPSFVKKSSRGNQIWSLGLLPQNYK